MQALTIIAFLIGIIFLMILVYFGNQMLRILSKEKIDDEYEYMYNRLQRYASIHVGQDSEIVHLKTQFDINVNFQYFIVGEQMLYLFDNNKKLFAVYDLTVKKTYLVNIKRAIEMFDEFELQFHKHKNKSGNILILPSHYFLNY